MNEEALLYLGVGLLAVSLLVIVLEAFIPSAGLLSLLSLASGITGLILLYRVDWKWGAAGTLGMLVLVPTVFVFGLQMLPSTPVGRRLLGAADDGAQSPPGPDPMAALIGQEGTAITDLRPVGAIRIGAERHPALAETSYILAGTRVRVTAVEGTQIKVRPVA